MRPCGGVFPYICFVRTAAPACCMFLDTQNGPAGANPRCLRARPLGGMGLTLSGLVTHVRVDIASEVMMKSAVSTWRVRCQNSKVVSGQF